MMEVEVRLESRTVDEDGEIEQRAAGPVLPPDVLQVVNSGLDLIEKAVALAVAGGYVRRLVKLVRSKVAGWPALGSGLAACLAARQLVKDGFPNAAFLFLAPIVDDYGGSGGGYLVGFNDAHQLYLVAVSRSGGRQVCHRCASPRNL